MIVNFVGNETTAQDVVSDVHGAGSRAAAVPGSVADNADVARIFDAAEHHFGDIDVGTMAGTFIKVNLVFPSSR